MLTRAVPVNNPQKGSSQAGVTGLGNLGELGQRLDSWALGVSSYPLPLGFYKMDKDPHQEGLGEISSPTGYLTV